MTSAAAIAAGLTFGFDGLSAALSDRAPASHQTVASKVEVPSLQASEETVRGTLPAISSSAVAERMPDEAVLSISADASSTHLLSQPLAHWNALVVFQSARLDGAKTSAVVEAAANPPVPPTTVEPGPPLPKSRPAAEKPLPTKLASATQDFETPVRTQPPPVVGFFQNMFRFEPPKPAAFPAEASGKTAVYDIETRAVYLPTGEILEAHSGLGEHMDDVRYVQEKMRGPTPPNVYALTLREKPFHGVQAIRLTPVATGNMFGRAGILAHPYMLGPNGQSNGCVSIENYPKFLQAYLNGKVDRLIVVPRLASTPQIVNASATAEKRTALFRPI